MSCFLDYEQIEVEDTAVPCEDIPNGARRAWIQAEGGEDGDYIRYMLHGGTPTASLGMILRPGEPPTILDYANLDLSLLKFIVGVGDTLYVNVTYLDAG